MLQKFIFPRPTSFFISAMTVVYVLTLPLLGLLEVADWHLPYSNFWNFNSNLKPFTRMTLSGRVGMVLGYSPAFLIGISSFWIFPDEGLRLLLVKSTLTIHFSKRVFECLFIHKYGSNMAIEVAVFIIFAYFMGVVSFIYAQYLTQGSAEPGIDTKYIGTMLFLVGISGSSYHHCILSKLRKNEGDKKYNIPKGGLFRLVVCPHCLFEIVEFVGISFICQTVCLVLHYWFCCFLDGKELCHQEMGSNPFGQSANSPSSRKAPQDRGSYVNQ